MFQSFLYHIDVFKSPLTLFFNKKPFISTCLGPLLSIGIIEIILLAKSDFFSHKSPATSASNLRLHQNVLSNLIRKS